MHLTWRQTLATLVTIGALLGAAGRVCPAAASPLSHSPLVVTMSGTLQPFNEPQSHDLNTLTVTIGDKQQRLFKVDRVDTVTDTQPGVMLLSEIFPPKLRIKGSSSDMAVLDTRSLNSPPAPGPPTMVALLSARNLVMSAAFASGLKRTAT